MSLSCAREGDADAGHHFLRGEDGFAVAGVELVDRCDPAGAFDGGDLDFGVEREEGGDGVGDGGAVDENCRRGFRRFLIRGEPK